ncbi:MAG TPA: PQQ-binding-like beta-propeller repeat protein [Gemmataceae bacterium]|nr:PQQ-binding-like beta-propeller repeat protein [Gemmataceae bacterium]
MTLRLASTGDTSPVRLWDLGTGKQVGGFRDRLRADDIHGGSCYVAFSPDGKLLATSDYTGPSRVLDAATGQERWRVAAGPQWDNGMVFSPDSKVLVLLVGQANPTIYRYEAATGKPLPSPEGHTGPVSAVAFAPGGRTLVSLGSDQTLRAWEVATGKPLRQTPAPNSGAFTSSADGRLLAIARNRALGLYDTTTGKELRRLVPHAAMTYGLAFSPDGRVLASAGADANTDHDYSLALWSVSSGKELHRMANHSRCVTGVAFTADGRSLDCLAIGSANEQHHDPPAGRGHRPAAPLAQPSAGPLWARAPCALPRRQDPAAAPRRQYWDRALGGRNRATAPADRAAEFL